MNEVVKIIFAQVVLNVLEKKFRKDLGGWSEISVMTNPK